MDEQFAASSQNRQNPWPDSDKQLHPKTICSLLRTRKSILIRKHVLHRFYILFKRRLSINEIARFFNPLEPRSISGNDDVILMQDVYLGVFSLEAEESQKLLKDLGKKYKIAGETFEDFPDEDQKFLHTFSFICMLSFDVYIKKKC